MTESIGNCSRCGQPMIEHRFSRHYVLTCNNPGCSLRREPQGYRIIETAFAPSEEVVPIVTPIIETKEKRKHRRKVCPS